MGFTERASCRPYKNCYKKTVRKNKMVGGKTRKTKTPKSKSSKTLKSKSVKSGVVSPSSKHVNHPSFIYHSEHMTYTSHPHKNSPYGKRTIVNITNGVGKKHLETLNKNGKTLKVNVKKLNKGEISEIKQGNYVPGLWLSV